MKNWDAIIIGAGHNGLIAAGYLARAGKRVLVLERREIVGGACVTEEVWPGYRVSTAAYLCSLLRPEIIEDLELAKYGYEVYQRDTAGFAPFPDGSSLFLYADAQKTRAALESFCKETPEDAEAYFVFEREVGQVTSVLQEFMLREPPPETELLEAFASAGIASLYEEFVTGGVRELLDRRFKSDKLKVVLATDGLIGTFGGPSTPGTAYVLTHHYLGNATGVEGAWGYVRGGMGVITQALAKGFLERGGEIRTSCEVEEILLEAGRAVGVRLAGGEVLRANAVLSNADPHRTFNRLLKRNDIETQDASNENDLSALSEIGKSLISQGGASCKINLAVSELPRFSCLPKKSSANGATLAGGASSPGEEHLGTVHICPDLEHLERAWAEAKSGRPSTEPMIEMYLQTATDSSLTPPGKHILSLFTQYFPYNLAPGLILDEERERYADRVIEIVGRYAPNVPASILHRQILTPRDLEARFGLTGGHIFHGDLLPPNLWESRPAAGFHGSRTPIQGLYLCGSGVHPGGCVFGAPGWNAAHQVLEDGRKYSES